MYSFSYSLGDTPDGILNEIWVALPSLRELLEGVQWWNMVLKITWTQLLKAVLGEAFSTFSAPWHFFVNMHLQSPMFYAIRFPC